MKKTIVLMLVFGVTQVFAQEYETGKIDISVGFGFRSSSSSSLSLNDYQKLFPDSELLKGDFSSFGYPNYYYNSTSMVNLLWGIRLKQNKAFEQRLRVGVTFSGTTPSYGGFYNESAFAFDTLTSSRTGEVTYVDSVFSENVYIPISQSQVGLDVSYILRSNQNGRWSFYGGVGVELGAIINAEANISRSDYSYYSNAVGNYYNNDLIYGRGNNSVTETEQLDGGFYGMLYMPFGLDLRLSMKNAFWRKMHVYIEFRPNLQYSNSELVSNNVQAGVGFTALGLRAEF